MIRIVAIALSLLLALNADAAIHGSNPSDIIAAFTPARTGQSGDVCVSPCAIFFDASATTSASTSFPLHELDYSWDFGDGASGNWTYGSSTGTCGNGLTAASFNGTITGTSLVVNSFNLFGTATHPLLSSLTAGDFISGASIPAGTWVITGPVTTSTTFSSATYTGGTKTAVFNVTSSIGFADGDIVALNITAIGGTGGQINSLLSNGWLATVSNSGTTLTFTTNTALTITSITSATMTISGATGTYTLSASIGSIGPETITASVANHCAQIWNISKNKAYGPWAAHVYEPAPGSGSTTYTVNLTVKNSTGTTNTQHTITVADPNVVFGGTWSGGVCSISGSQKGCTVCLSPSGVYDVAPCTTAANQDPLSVCAAGACNWPTILSTYTAAPTRILLHKGENFNVTAAGGVGVNQIVADGPGIIDSYGASGAPPLVIDTGVFTAGTRLGMTAGSGSFIGDWRARNFDVDTQNNQGNAFLQSPIFTHQMLYENLNISATYAFPGSQGTPDPIANSADQYFIVNTTFQNATLGNGTQGGGASIFPSNQRLAVMGNDWENTTLEQQGDREQSVWKGVTSHNYFSRANAYSGKATFLIHGDGGCIAPGCTTPKIYGQHVVADNIISNECLQGEISTVNPESGSFNEPVVDVIFERNIMEVCGGANQGIHILANQLTFRLNIWNAQNMKANAAEAMFALDGPTANQITAGMTQITNAWYYNNTFYSSRVDSSAFGQMYSSSTGTEINQRFVNNLAYSPNDTIFRVSNSGNCGSGGGGCTLVTSSTNAQARSTTPGFVGGATPAAPGDFLPVGSYANASGTASGLTSAGKVPVFYDFCRNPFPAGSPNLGALQASCP